MKRVCRVQPSQNRNRDGLHLATETVHGVMICSSVEAEAAGVDLGSTSNTGDGALGISFTLLLSTTTLPLRSPARTCKSIDTTFRATGRRLPVAEGVEQGVETPIWVGQEKNKQH